MKETKKKRRLWLLPLLALAAVLLLTKPAGDQSGVEVIEENRSATVTVGSLETALLGGGSLSESESRSLRFAGDVRLLQWEVGENEVVVEGQTLATVDKNSVLSAISELSKLMDKLDKALESSRNSKGSTTLTAPVAGRIVAIYAEAGDEVQSVVAEHGALLLLSLDGRLSVDVPAASLAAGDAVSLQRSDGSLLDAVVSEVSEGIATVTVSDALCEFGEEVSVLDEDELFGSGKLSAHRPLGITGFNGRVAAVYGKVGGAVYKGQTLLTLTDTDYAGEYESLLQKRRTLEQQMDALYALYDAGALLAPETGYVSALNTAAVGLGNEKSSGSGRSGFSLPFPLSSLSGGGRIVLLADLDPAPADPVPPEDGEVETYTLAGTIAAVDMENGTVELTLTDGSPLTLSILELAEKCKLTDMNALAAGNLLMLRFLVEDDSLYGCTVYEPYSGEQKRPSGGGFSFGGGTKTTEAEETYVAKETELCTLTVFNRTDVVLSVDELDVGSLYVGKSVEVTLDALPGQVFPAEITEIDPNGSNSGGNSKYSVTVTMERSGEMLSGMNASVRIPLDTHDDLLLLPAAAIREDGNGVFVYTAYDGKNGYTGRQAVSTGLSDGEMVEILSGLSEGDTVYYPFAESMEYTFTN